MWCAEMGARIPAACLPQRQVLDDASLSLREVQNQRTHVVTGGLQQPNSGATMNTHTHVQPGPRATQAGTEPQTHRTSSQLPPPPSPLSQSPTHRVVLGVRAVTEGELRVGWWRGIQGAERARGVGDCARGGTAHKQPRRPRVLLQQCHREDSQGARPLKKRKTQSADPSLPLAPCASRYTPPFRCASSGTSRPS